MLSHPSLIKNSKKNNPSKIIGIQFSVMSPEDIRKTSVAHITSRDTYVNNKPVIGGLFDPRMGVLEPGLTCPTDGLNYIDTPGYFGHIDIPVPIFEVHYLNHIIKVLRCVCHKCGKLLIDKKEYSHALSYSSKDRWDFVFDLASKVKQCGEVNEGCGFEQPVKIMKDGYATINAMPLRPSSVSVSFGR